MLNNDEIARNIGDVGMAKDAGNAGKIEDARDIGKAKDVRDGKNTRNIGEVGNIGDAGNVENVWDKKTRKSNNRAANGENWEDNEVGNTEVGDGKHQKTGKLEDVKVGNNGVDDNGN